MTAFKLQLDHLHTYLDFDENSQELAHQMFKVDDFTRYAYNT